MNCCHATSIAAQFFGITQCDLREILMMLVGLSVAPGAYMIGRDRVKKTTR